MQRALTLFAVALAVFVCCEQYSSAQGTLSVFTCIGANTTSACTNGDQSLREENSSTPPKYVSVSGFYNISDGGEGDFQRLGSTQGSGAVCVTSTTGNWQGTPGSPTIEINTLPSGLTIGENASGFGTNIQIQPGSEIASINPTGPSPSVTLTLPLTGTAAQSFTVTFTGDNGGTLIVDAGHDCYQKTNYRGDPHEFGAIGNGNNNPNEDDAPNLQNWLGAPGPWDAALPATYITSKPLICPPNANLRAPANDSREDTVVPLVTIQAGKGTGNMFNGGSGGSQASPLAVLTADQQCRISGLAIDANNVSNGSTLFVDAVNIAGGIAPFAGTGVIVDSHALLERGYYNLLCDQPVGNPPGLQLKDSQFNKSWSDNIHIGVCPNDRLIGDVVAQAGALDKANTDGVSQAGIYFSGDEMTVSNGVIEQSQGIGLDLNTASQMTIAGMYFDSNGESTTTGGAGVEIDTSKNISLCNSHFHRNDNSGSASSAQIRFGGSPSDNITVCGNIYLAGVPTCQGCTTTVPQYVYDGPTGSSVVTNSSFYENPKSQVAGVFSPGAARTVLPSLSFSPGTPNNYITGLTLSNDATFLRQVHFAAGRAMDSTNSTIIALVQSTPNVAACTVDLNGPNGAGGLDTGSVLANTTYFYFVISQAGGGANANCIASASPTPTLPTGYGLFRMVGALYTQQNATTVVPFVQSDDTFTLLTSVPLSSPGGIGLSSTQVTLTSVPSQISVEAFGRCAANAAVSLSAGNVTAQPPNANFLTTPGYAVNAPMPNTSFPFELYTAGGSGPGPSATINAAATAVNTPLTCYNDGWVWHRGK